MKTRVKWDPKLALRVTDELAGEALMRGAELVLAKSNEIVPYNEGVLQASGHVDVDTRARIATISYDTPYAVRLHENPQYTFQHGRRGKWLEQTLKIYAKQIGEIFARTFQGGWPKS